MAITKKPPSVRVAEGRRRLHAAKFERMQGANNPRFEIWLDEQGCPHVINFVGPPYGEYYLKKDLDQCVPLN